MAQIYVNSVMVKPKSIHVYNSSARLWEEDRIGYVRVNGEWIPFIEYQLNIYDEGIEYIEIVQGAYSLVNGTIPRFDKRSDNILFSAPSRNTAVTSTMVDLSNYTSLYIDWEQTTGTAINNKSLLVVGALPDGDTPVASFEKIRGFERRIDVLDISSLEGDFYVSVQIRNSSSLNLSQIIVYKIWGE